MGRVSGKYGNSIAAAYLTYACSIRTVSIEQEANIRHAQKKARTMVKTIIWLSQKLI